MQCPYCGSSALETAAACGRCGLSLEKCDRLFGTVPALRPGLTDLAGATRASDRRRLLASIAALRRRFPQVHFSAVVIRLGEEIHPGVYAFWLFNRGDLCRQTERGGDNRDVLLLVDPEHRRASFMIGYGLEPFVGRSQLESALMAARNDFAAGRFAAGIRTALDSLADELERASSAIDDTFGVSLASIYAEESGSAR